MIRYNLNETQYGQGHYTWYEKHMEEERDGEWVGYDHARLAMSRAFAMAAHQATGQVRKYTGVPYDQHPFCVRLILQNAKDVTIEMYMAADLHDVVEDTKVSIDTIEEVFGPVVRQLVAGMTKTIYPPGSKRKYKFEQEVIRLSGESPEVKTLKIADSIHNMLDFIKNDPDYARDVYLPEKRILLDSALKEGDTTLWNMADQIIKDFK